MTFDSVLSLSGANDSFSYQNNDDVNAQIRSLRHELDRVREPSIHTVQLRALKNEKAALAHRLEIARKKHQKLSQRASRAEAEIALLHSELENMRAQNARQVDSLNAELATLHHQHQGALRDQKVLTGNVERLF
jgi:chromosome segregation ATPase